MDVTRGRQYELPPEPERASEPPESFGLMLRRPGGVANPDADWGEEGVYLAPDFTTRHLHHNTSAGSDPRCGEDWSLSLPHSCGEWVIDCGDLDSVLAEALRFRDELDQAIDALRAEIPLPGGPRYYVKEAGGVC